MTNTTKKTPHLIGLTGYAGSGKDTVRAVLAAHGYMGMAFADPIRQMLRALFDQAGVCHRFMDGRDLKESTIPQLGVSYRHLAQTLGTEWGRAVAPDLWLRIASGYINDANSAGELWSDGVPLFAISDVRFANEAQWVRDRGGVVWRINRPQAAAVRAHSSESEVAQLVVDAEIDNSGSLDDLKRNVALALANTTDVATKGVA